MNISLTLLDFKKAFDTVKHSILIKKIRTLRNSWRYTKSFNLIFDKPKTVCNPQR